VKRQILMRGLILAMVLALFSFLTLTGCAPQIKYTIPPLQEKAVPNLPLEPRPRLDLTDEEIMSLEKFSSVITGKILKNQSRWWAYGDVADAAVKGYQDFILSVFGGKPTEPRPPEKKKSWWGGTK
jgi:hypothetical protein